MVSTDHIKLMFGVIPVTNRWIKKMKKMQIQNLQQDNHMTPSQYVLLKDASICSLCEDKSEVFADKYKKTKWKQLSLIRVNLTILKG